MKVYEETEEEFNALWKSWRKSILNPFDSRRQCFKLVLLSLLNMLKGASNGKQTEGLNNASPALLRDAEKSQNQLFIHPHYYQCSYSSSLTIFNQGL